MGLVIKSFRHKGLKELFESGNKKGVNPENAGRLMRVLDRLDASKSPSDMNLPGYKLHELSGRSKGTWSVAISGNWRLTFEFEGEDAVNLDYLDYH